jgi:hypothetical protein
VSVVSGGVGCLIATGWLAAATPALRHYRRESGADAERESGVGIRESAADAAQDAGVGIRDSIAKSAK